MAASSGSSSLGQQSQRVGLGQDMSGQLRAMSGAMSGVLSKGVTAFRPLGGVTALPFGQLRGVAGFSSSFLGDAALLDLPHDEEGYPAAGATGSAGSFSSKTYADSNSSKQIQHLLSSKHVGEQTKALKKLLALVSNGRDVSSFFPAVINHLATQNLEVKKLVYIFVARYAEQCQDEALLSVNAFQRDLGAADASVRAIALRVMSGIRVAAIVPIVAEAVRQCSRDSSAAVRRAAAAAMPKVFAVDRQVGAALATEIGGKLMQDKVPSVVGGAVSALFLITQATDGATDAECKMLHAHFRRLCACLGGLEEWAQVMALEWLLRYARHHFTDPNLAADESGETDEAQQQGQTEEEETTTNELDGATDEEPVTAEAAVVSPPAPADDTNVKKEDANVKNSLLTAQQRRAQDSFYDDDDENGGGDDDAVEDAQAGGGVDDNEADGGDGAVEEVQASTSPPEEKQQSKGGRMQEDHILMLQHVRPLVSSRNNAVILSACRLLMHAGIASDYDIHRCAASLTFALRANAAPRHSTNSAAVAVGGGDPQAQECILQLLLYLCVHTPHTVRPYLRRILVDHVCDTPRVVALKLDAYSYLASPDNMATLLAEYESCIRLGSACGDLEKVCAAVLSLANCAQRVPSVVEPCLRTLVALSIGGANEEAREHAARCACVLVRREPGGEAQRRAIATLVRCLRGNRLSHGAARARVLACVAAMLEDGEAEAEVLALTALTAVAGNFAAESAVARLATLGLADTVARKCEEGRRQAADALLEYLLALARCDPHRDVRDKARAIAAAAAAAAAALVGAPDIELIGSASGVADQWSATPAAEPAADPGTLSQLVGHAAPGWRPLPSWPEVATDSRVREMVTPMPAKAANADDDGGSDDGSEYSYSYESEEEEES